MPSLVTPISVRFVATSLAATASGPRQLSRDPPQAEGNLSRFITGNNYRGTGPTVPIKLWDAATRRHLLSLGHDDEVGSLSQVGFLPDGNGIYAVTEQGLHVWQVPSLTEIDTADEAR